MSHFMRLHAFSVRLTSHCICVPASASTVCGRQHTQLVSLSICQLDVVAIACAFSVCFIKLNPEAENPSCTCRWLKIEQHKLQGIDSSWAEALAAAKESGALDVQYKLEALIGVQLPQSPPNPLAAASAAGAGMGDVASVTQNFKPDLALKQELHDIKVKKRQRLVNLTLPVPTPREAAAAVAAGVVPSSSSSSALNTTANGTRQFGLPDPTCGAVPEGWVAVRWAGMLQAESLWLWFLLFASIIRHVAADRCCCCIACPRSIMLALEVSGALAPISALYCCTQQATR